ncbi:hypothetical protein DESC_320058 [Desulfosarcina cetonica]|nr:hypothetical protein DESC_320058 [Desulfosarcina cetonica]
MSLQEETVRCQLQAQHLLQALGARRRLHAHGQDQHLQIMVIQLPRGRILHGHPQAAVGQLRHMPRQAADVMGALAPAAREQILKAFAKGTDVDVENLDLHVRVVFLEHQGAFDRVHAAGVGAIGSAPPGRPRAHALDKADALGRPPVGGPHQFSLGGAAGVDQTFELEAGEHVGKARVAVLVQLARVVGGKARGHDDGADPLGKRLVGHVKIDALLLTGIQALGAHRGVVAQALAGVEHIGRRHGLGKRRVDRPARGKPDIEFIRPHHRTDLGAIATGRTGRLVHVAGLLDDFHVEVAHVAFDVHHLAQGVEGNAGMPTGIRHFRPQDSNGAVHGGKGLVQLGHDPADGGLLFHHDDLIAVVGQVQGGLDAGHATADHQGTLGHGQVRLTQRTQSADPCHGHLDQVPGLFRGRSRIVHVHPAALLAQVGHLQEVGIEPGILEHLTEGRLVQARRAGGHHDAA